MRLRTSKRKRGRYRAPATTERQLKKREHEHKYVNSAKGKAGHQRRGRESQAAFTALLHRLKSVPCMDCGGTFDPVCMDFDHRPGEVKLANIGKFRATSPRLMAEIAKCDVVCANCHRLRTHRIRDHRAVIAAPSRVAVSAVQTVLPLVETEWTTDLGGEG